MEKKMWWNFLGWKPKWKMFRLDAILDFKLAAMWNTVNDIFTTHAHTLSCNTDQYKKAPRFAWIDTQTWILEWPIDDGPVSAFDIHIYWKSSHWIKKLIN